MRQAYLRDALLGDRGFGRGFPQFCEHASVRFQTFGACFSSRPLPSQGGESGLIPGTQVLGKHLFLKGLILAQNERWRRGLGMQVERIPWG